MCECRDEGFEAWKVWFDSHKESDGSINLSKHPDLIEYMKNFFLGRPHRADLSGVENKGSTVNYDVAEMRRG